MYYIMVFIKSDILSMNKVDMEKFFFCLSVLLSIDYCLGKFLKKIKKCFIIFLQILKTKFKSFKEKFNFFKTQNTLQCLQEKFKRKNLQSVSAPLCLRQKFFFSSYTPQRILCIPAFCFNFCAWETYLVISSLFQKRNTKCDCT